MGHDRKKYLMNAIVEITAQEFIECREGKGAQRKKKGS